MDEGRNRTAKVDQGLQLDGSLGLAKRRQLEQAQTQVNGSGVQGVDRILEIEFQVLVQIKLARATDQNSSQVEPMSSVGRLVGTCQGGAVNSVAKSHGVQLAQVGSKSHFEVSQALSPSQFCKRDDAKLLGASQTSYARVAAIASQDARKACPWNELHDLRQQGFADIHWKPPRSLSLGKFTIMRKK